MAAGSSIQHAYPTKGLKMYYFTTALDHTPPIQFELHHVMDNPLVFWEARLLPIPNLQQHESRRVVRWMDSLGLSAAWENHFIRSFLSLQKAQKKQGCDGEVVAKAFPEQAVSSPVMLALLSIAHQEASMVGSSVISECVCLYRKQWRTFFQDLNFLRWINAEPYSENKVHTASSSTNPGKLFNSLYGVTASSHYATPSSHQATPKPNPYCSVPKTSPKSSPKSPSKADTKL